ncbi:unnamed protein product [Phytomonas sp. Hart1]|nr:unnamed protein product [Phytomonas sp. Hart1]|eukprot:CCW71673.1 unnamed protein product [Phytomonas sp. isolate Hart1]
MSLRSVHTLGIREAIKNRGVLGLKAHKTKIHNITTEIQRIALTLGPQSDGQQVVLSALSYLQFAGTEIDHALSIGIGSISDLDSTPMFQTFITEFAIVTRVMGIVIPYGLEFFGNDREPFFIPQMLEKAISILSLTVGGRSIPLLNHTRDTQMLLQSLCHSCGLFFITVSCSQTTTLDTMRSYLRGALGTGAFFCVSEYRKLDVEIQFFLTECFRRIQNGNLACASINFVTGLALETHSEFTKASVHPNFMGVITASEPLHKITREFSQEYRPIYLPRMKLVDVICVYLDAYGITDESQTASPKFAVMYEHLQEIFPSVFTYPKLLAVLQYATKSGLCNEGHATDCLFEAFTCIFASVLTESKQLKALLEFYVKHTLGLPVSNLRRTLSTLLLSKRNVKSEFAETISFCHQVMISGPHFSGKAKLWRDFVGKDKHVVLCTSLMTAHEFYEHNAVEGILKVLAGVAATPLERHFVIIEDETFLCATSWINLSLYGRVLGPRKTSFTLTPSSYMIVCTNTLQHTDPHVICDFAIFSLPAPSDWRSFLRDRLHNAPGCDVATSVMEMVLPVVWTAVEHGDCNKIHEDVLNTNLGFYAICKQCINLYFRWYNYIAQPYCSPTSFVREEVADLQLNTHVFAARCVVQAICWSMGLALDPYQLDHMKKALLGVEDSLNEFMENYNSMDKILPPLEENENMLDFVVTRSGWKLLSEAISHINDLSWSEYAKIDPQSEASSQRFPTPSRLSTLRVIECLINCGQHVSILGSCGSGKSSLLKSTRLCERWIQHFVNCSKDFSPIRTQNQLASQLLPRSTSTFGPPLGSKLVVCIDDMHLSSSTHANVPIASSLVLFYEKYSAISTPTLGFIPTTDLVYVGTTLGGLRIPSVQCAFINVYLPRMQGSELVNGIWKLLEATCGKRRTDAFPRECTSFVILAYRAVERAIAGNSVIGSGLRGGNDIFHTASVPWVSMGRGLSLNDTISSQLEAKIVEAESILPQRFGLALHGVEIARRQLSSGISDLQVAVNLFVGVESLYVGHYAADANRENLWEDILDCAQATLGKCLGDSKFLAAIKQERCDELYSSSNRQMCVLKWFEGIHTCLSETGIQPLAEMNPYASNHSFENKNVDISTDLYCDRGQLSICVTTPNSFSVASLSQNSSLVSPSLWELSQRQIKHIKGTSRSDEQTCFSSVDKWKFEATTFIVADRVDTIASIVTQSKCITENAFEIVQTVKHMGSPLHIVILCKSIFEIVSLTFIVVVATRFPVALIRPYRGYYYTGKEAKYDFNSFATDMKTLVNYVYANNVRMVVVIPNSVLSIPLVMRQIDLLISVGDLSEIFSREELWCLVHGSSTFHPNQLTSRHIMGVLSPSEEETLYAYIRQCFIFILQIYDENNLNNSLESGRYRCFAHIRILRGLDIEGVVSMQRGIVYSIISRRNKSHNSTEFNYYNCGSQELADLVYSFYEASQEFFPDIREECISDFASLVIYIERMCAEKMKDNALIATVLVDRGDVVTKLIKNNAQLSTQATEELDRLREDIVELTKRLEEQNMHLEHYRADFQKAQKDVEEGALELSKYESAQNTLLAKAKEMVCEAAVPLKKVKPPAIQLLSKSLSSKKLILLIRAVYCVLGEEIPRSIKHPNELWAAGIRRMCAPGFVQSIIAASTENVVDPPTLLLLERDLKKTDFGKSSVCAQLIVDYILAFIKKLRVQQAKIDDNNTYSVQKELNQDAENRLKQCTCRVYTISEEICTIKEDIKELERKCCEVQERQRLSVERGKRLFVYLNSIDSFTRFAAPVEDIDEQVRRANCAQGDTLLMAAYNSLLSMHYPNDALYKNFQNILHDHGVPFTEGPEVPARELLFRNHGSLIDLLISPALPFRHRCALYNLHQHIVRRWQLFGGVCEFFNEILKEYLLYTCNGCMVVSVHDNNAKKSLIQAMQSGSGVLLYNLETDPMSTELIVALFPLFGKLDIEWENCRPGVHMKGCAGNGTTKGEKGIPFYVFGQNIVVHPKFNLICVSFALVRPFYARESLCTTIFSYVSLTNFFEPIPLSVRIWYGLLHSRGTLRNVKEGLHKLRRRIFSEVTSFIGKHDHSSKLLSGDLEHISNCEKHELEILDEILKDANAHDGQIATLKVQLQMIHKQIAEAWPPIETSLKQCAELLRFIEADKLGRSWDDRVIDPFLSSATSTVPNVGTSFASLRFKDHTLAQKQFYAVVNFVDNIVSCFSCGWPLSVRGFFSVLILHGALLASGSISSYLGAVFPTLEILNLAQYNALLSIFGKDSKYNIVDFPLSSCDLPKDCENTEKTGTEGIKRLISQVYLDSGDTVLKRIVSKNLDNIENSTSSSQSDFSSLVPNFFQFLLRNDFPRCEDIALRLYASTLDALKGNNLKFAAPHRQSSHKVSEMTYSTVQEMVLTSNNNSLVDCTSSASSFSHSQLSTVSCNFPLIRLYMREQLWEQNAKHCLPLYMVSRNPYATLYDIQHEADLGNWVYEQHEVIGLNVETNMLAIRIVNCLLKPHMRDNFKGFWFGLFVDLSSPKTKKAISENTNINYGKCLVESIHKIISTYIGSNFLVEGDNESFSNRILMRFVLVCTPESHHLLWKGAHEFRPGRCLYISDELTTPQRHLLHLLEDKTFQDMLAQQSNQDLERLLPSDSPLQSKEIFTMSPDSSRVMTAQGSGTGVFFTDRRASGKFFRGTQNVPVRGAVSPMWRILIKELWFVHISISARRRLLNDFKRIHLETYFDDEHCADLYFNDDAVICSDHILRFLIQLIQRIWNDDWTWRKSNCEFTEVASERDSGPIMSLIPTASTSKGLRAHYYYRNQRRAWQQLHQEIARVQLDFTTMSKSMSQGTDNQIIESSKHKPSLHSTTFEPFNLSQILDTNSIDFTWIQKLVYQLYTILTEEDGANVNVNDHETLKLLLKVMIVLPSNYEGVADAEPTVTYGWPWLDSPCSFVLNASDAFRMIEDVKRSSSDLLRLCGDTNAVVAYRARVQERVFRLLFSTVSLRRQHHSEAPRGIADNNMNAVFPELSLALQLSCREELLKDLAPLNLEYAHLSQLYNRLREKKPRLSQRHYSLTIARVLNTIRSLAFVTELDLPSSLTSPIYSSSYLPGGNVQVWLPSLRHSLVVLWNLTRSLLSLAPVSQHGWNFGHLSELVLIVTQRRFLAPCDVVLEGASLSACVMEEIHAITGWALPFAFKQPWKDRETLLSKGTSQILYAVPVVNALSMTGGDEIVIAMRSMCVKKDLDNGVSEFHTFNWTCADATQQHLDITKTSEIGVVEEGKTPLLASMMWNAEPYIMKVRFFDHKPCEFLWNATTKPANLQSYLRLFASNSKEQNMLTETEPTDEIKSVFLTQNGDDITDSTVKTAHSPVSLSTEKRTFIHYKVSQLPIPILTIQFNFLDCTIEDNSAIPSFHRIGEAPLCIIYEAHTPLLSLSGKDNRQDKPDIFSEQSCSIHKQDKSNQKPTSVGTLGRYVLIE